LIELPLSLTPPSFYSNDTSCVCSNTQFQSSLATCLSSCSSSDVTIAQQLQKETCSNGLYRLSELPFFWDCFTDTQFPASTTSTGEKPSASATNSTTSSTPSSKSTKSNGAAAIEQLPLLSAVIVIAGALMGGAFIL
jgi:CFEM domain